MARYDDTFVDRGAVEPARCRRRVGADDRRLRLGGYERPRAAWHPLHRADGRPLGDREAFKALPDVNYQPVRNSFGEDRCLHMMDAGDDALTDGFHSFEADNSFRWTNGDATLPPKLFRGVEGPLELSLYVSATTRYLDDGKPHAA